MQGYCLYPSELKNYILHSYAEQHILLEKADQLNRKNCKGSPMFSY